jgi:flagellar basal-body rod protein FlgB
MSDIKSPSLFGVHAAALAFREERLRVIAGNLANADTPGYKAKDLDFSKALEAAAGQQDAYAPRATQPGHIAGASVTGEASTVYRVPLQPSLDGNTVDGESENAAFGRAALEYRSSLMFIEGRLRSLLTAITGQ